jgi:hypothetical protein
MEPNVWNVVTLASVDVVVVGAGTAAVAAALECRERGLTVRVLSDLTHLSEESAGRLDLWPSGLDRSDPLVSAIYPTGEVPFPGAMKRAAEQMLLAAGVPYLYSVRPVGVLAEEGGAVSGLLVAARTSVVAIRCGTVIDASRFGVVSLLANVATTPRSMPKTQSSWTVLATRAPEWAGEVLEIGTSIVLPNKDTTENLSAWQLSVDSISASSPASFTHLLRAALVDPAVRLCAPTVPQSASIVLSGHATQATLDSVPDAAFSPMPGLLIANGLLPIDTDAVQTLDRTDVQARLGRRVARLVQRRTPGSDLHCIQPRSAIAGDDRVDRVFARDGQGQMRIRVPGFAVIDRADVVVAGGGTGGAPAGIGAARSGAKTIVLESQTGMGGVGTLGLIASYWFGNRVGFTEELDKLVEQTDTIRTTNKSRWNPELKMAIYHRLLRDAGGDAWMRSFAFGVRMKGDRVAGLLVSTPWGAGIVEAGAVVDSTGNADIPAAAGCRTRWIGADHVACQGTGLSPLNPVLDYRNSDHNFIDDADPEGVTHALTNARAKFPKEFDTSPLVDSRERRQIVGDVELSPLDILAERTFPDTLVTASSNFDTHGFTVHPVFFVLAPDKKPLTAHVPIRAMLPRDLDGVIVTGLGASAHRDALPVIRMQADVQNQGFAAGMVAADSAKRGCAMRQVDVRSIQKRLIDLKLLAPDIASHTDSFPLPAGVVGAAVDVGATDFKNAAILFANFDVARPGLIKKLTDLDRAKAEDAALVLGLMGESAGLDLLLAQLDRQGWDRGWNYRGMGQFGMSSSRLDAVILAVGRIGDARAIATVKKKVEQLAEDSAFSHCRCAAIAAAALGGASLASSLLTIIRLPGMTGHAHLDTSVVATGANSNLEETEARNNALREIYLARGLYLCGDIDGVGESILRTYAGDLRGQFARHAQAVLATPVDRANTQSWA